MGDKRTTLKSLWGTRIYARSGSFQYYSPKPIPDPRSGKLKRWHVLCPISDGELKAREAKERLINAPSRAVGGRGDFPFYFAHWQASILARRNQLAPANPARRQTWDSGTRSLQSQLAVIEGAFRDYDVTEGILRPCDIAEFVDRWERRRAAISYRGHLSHFFQWCIRKGLRESNPADATLVPLRHDKSEPPEWSAERFCTIYNALLCSEKGKPLGTGPMMQCYVDLCFLLYQRATDVRLLTHNQFAEAGVEFKPTKTERSSGQRVTIPITDEIREVVDRAKKLGKVKGMYVIHDQNGQPYTASALRRTWNAACQRAGIKGLTIKSIRRFAAQTARRDGATLEQIKTALAHELISTTQGYLKNGESPISEIQLKRPKLNEK